MDARIHPVVAVRDVSKTFGETHALQNVSLEVPAGQMVALLGRSGSGKSTLLRMINGLHRPTTGTVEVLGCNVAEARGAELRTARRRIGFVFQQFELVSRLSALENVLSGALGRVRGPRLGVLSYPVALRREALAHLDRVGIADRAFQRSGTLSGGQQQRVAVARALMQQPKILLADEPVASLDPETSDQVMELIFRICREDQLTVVISLHQVDLALKWAQRIVGLREGNLVFDADAATTSRERIMDIYRRVLADPETGEISEIDPLAAAAMREAMAVRA